MTARILDFGRYLRDYFKKSRKDAQSTRKKKTTSSKCSTKPEIKDAAVSNLQKEMYHKIGTLDGLKSIEQGLEEIGIGVTRVKAAMNADGHSQPIWEWKEDTFRAWIEEQEKHRNESSNHKRHKKNHSGRITFSSLSGLRNRSKPVRLQAAVRRGQVQPVDLLHDESIWVDIEYSDHFPRFLELPREMRDIVYEHSMVDLSSRFRVPRYHDFSVLTFYPKTLPGVCFTNKQLMEEGTLAYIRRTRFLIEDGGNKSQKQFMDWLSHFPDRDAYATIRQLGYVGTMMEYSTPFSSDWEERWNMYRTPAGLIAQCTGIRSLIFEISSTTLMDYNHGRERLKSLQEIESTMRFDRLFEVTSLRHLKLYCRAISYHTVRYNNGLGMGLSHQEIFASVLAILRDGFERRNRPVKVEVEWIHEK